MPNTQTFLQSLATMSEDNRNILKSNVASTLETHGQIPNPLGQDSDILSRLLIGSLSIAVTNFAAAYIAGALFDDNGNFEIDYEHLLRAVIVPTMLGVGLLSANEPDSENCIWSTHVCLKVLMNNGWNVTIIPDPKKEQFYIRNTIAQEVGGSMPGDTYSYTQLSSSVISIPFFKMKFKITRL